MPGNQALENESSYCSKKDQRIGLISLSIAIVVSPILLEQSFEVTDGKTPNRTDESNGVLAPLLEKADFSIIQSIYSKQVMQID